DEAHRFAITYHRKLKSKALRRSILDDIPGMGEKRKRVLLAHFNSIDEIRRANIEKLCSIPGIDQRTAESVHSYFLSK
ncbi:MAG: excinuclease ABC subunit C, partial [Candidatus Omnitrophica bacterium]|nr:excinuclease ABC subunit C [Candidatus Omnitrophota bacterium]